MIREFKPLVLLALLLASCDGQRGNLSENSRTAESQPLETKRIRPSIENIADPGEDHPVDLQEALKAAEEIPASAARDKALAEVAWNTIETDRGGIHCEMAGPSRCGNPGSDPKSQSAQAASLSETCSRIAVILESARTRTSNAG